MFHAVATWCGGSRGVNIREFGCGSLNLMPLMSLYELELALFKRGSCEHGRMFDNRNWRRILVSATCTSNAHIQMNDELGPPVVPFYPFLEEGSSTEIDYSLPEDLVSPASEQCTDFPRVWSGCSEGRFRAPSIYVYHVGQKSDFVHSKSE